MAFQAFSARMITDDKIRRDTAGGVPMGYEFKLRYPTYRGTYLCNIQELTVVVDGNVIPQQNMRIGLNGKWFLMSEVKECFKEYWFTLDAARLRVVETEPLADGPHTIAVEMKHKIPYTGYFGNYLVVDSRCTKVLDVEKGSEEL